MPRIENLSDYVKSVKSIAPMSLSSAAATTTAVACAGFARARHVIIVGVFGAGSTFDADITEAATAGATYTAISGSAIVEITAADAGGIIVIDVPVNNSKPFQKLRATATSSTVLVSSVCDLYNTHNMPTSPTFIEEIAVAGY